MVDSLLRIRLGEGPSCGSMAGNCLSGVGPRFNYQHLKKEVIF